MHKGSSSFTHAGNCTAGMDSSAIDQAQAIWRFWLHYHCQWAVLSASVVNYYFIDILFSFFMNSHVVFLPLVLNVLAKYFVLSLVFICFLGTK